MSIVVHTYAADATYTASAHLYYGTTDANGNPAATVHVDVQGAQGGSSLWGGMGAHISGDVPIVFSGTLTVKVGDAHLGGAGNTPGGAGGGSSAVIDSTGKLLIEAGGGGGNGSGGLSAPNAGGNADIGNGATNGDDYTHQAGPGVGANGTIPGTGGHGAHQTGGDGTTFAGSYGSVTGGVASTSSVAGGGGGGLAGGGAGGGNSGIGGGGGGGSSYVDTSVLNAILTLNSTGPLTAGPTQVLVTEVVVDAPLAPTPILPDPGSYVDVNLSTTLQWLYNAPVTDGGYSAYSLHLSGGAINGYWNGTDFSSTVAVYMPDTGGAMAIPDGILVAGVTYTWTVANEEGSYLQNGPASAGVTFIASNGPVATITAPTGTVAVSQPSIGFSIQLDDQSVLEDFQAIIYTAAQRAITGFTPGDSLSTWDSGPVDGQNILTGSTVVINGETVLVNGTYYLYVQLVETGSNAGPWIYGTFIVSYVAPTAPTLVVTNPIEPTTKLPYNQIVVTRTEATATAYLTVQYSDDNGATWSNVRGADYINVSGHSTFTVADYEAYPNTMRHYQAIITGA